MHTESCPSSKLSGGLDVCSTPNNTFILEEDLALSSSTLGLHDKSLQDHPDVSSGIYNPSRSLVYLNEETMDCTYSESTETPKTHDATNQVSSPEMFESEDEENDKTVKKDFSELLSRQSDKLSWQDSLLEDKCVGPTDEELIAKSDCYLLARINKFLAGVPPPPKHTICQSDCGDLLASIKANRQYFLIDPFLTRKEKDAKGESITTIDQETKALEITVTLEVTNNIEKKADQEDKIVQNHSSECSFNNHRGKSSLRNLTNAFNACERNDETTTSFKDEPMRRNFSETWSACRTSFESTSNENIIGNMRENDETENENNTRFDESTLSNLRTKEMITNREKTKHVTFQMPEKEIVPFFKTVSVEDVIDMPWDLAYKQKTHGIHYNRSRVVEEYEGLTLKLCQRYIGAETQSSCNIWFTKQAPGSVKKRNLLSRRNNGQSPGKRLSHLARRRRTFSSANLQGLGMADKKQLVLNMKKPTIRKGKSPRGKSPRGKSPRGSGKKRTGLSRISPSPRKTKLETSKRALFQSPPGDRAGPSNRTSSLVNASSQQRIKRALFPISKSKIDISAPPTLHASDIKRALNFEDSKKRKNEEELEGPRFKWAKSLSFDCTHITESNSSDSWMSERHSTGNFHMKSESSFQQVKSELSEAHRKKLLWAIAEALRGKGITMGHPRFKQCASQLARIVKKYMPDLENPNLPRKPGSTSDRMLRLAKRHVLLIVESKSTD
ncbi:uncharacterized protein mi [Venturia canescens]|uniref:uncharacterized protein mi n=1 Tax=Venturia canescens TaxID=32260 RepID=UPI001C9C827E|nr:uncharacterized protein LOC122416361 [Venturia canescens]